jgi:hypothetical protein
MLIENLFKQNSMPNLLPNVKSFTTKILVPSVKVIEEDCHTLIGRNVSADDYSMVGLLALDTDEIIDEQYVVDKYKQDIFAIRVRDTCACTSTAGICRKCLHGTYIRLGMDKEVPAVGSTVKLPVESSSYLNHLARTYSGSLVGVLPLASPPLPLRPEIFHGMITHEEMDMMIREMGSLKIPADEVDYLNGIHDKFERALMIVTYYGVYGNAFRK